jgi:hypothetical protein
MRLILYLLLLYLLLRFVFRLLSGGTRTIYFQSNHYHAQPQEDRSESAEPPPAKKSKGNDQQIGEYVDYEEIN